MLFLHKCVVVTCLFIAFVTSEALPRTQIDLLIRELENQTWLKDESKCLTDTLFLLNNAKNHTLWALWIWSSNQNPVGTIYGSRYSLGNYDQCMKAPSVWKDPKFHVQYCLADVKLTKGEVKKSNKQDDLFGLSDEYFKVKTKVGRSLNILTWGACLPASCKDGSAIKIFRTLYKLNSLSSEEPSISISDCQMAGEETVYSSQFWLFITVMVSLICTSILFTIFLQYANEDTKLTRIAQAFSLKRNFDTFSKIPDDGIRVLDFTKSVNLLLTTCCHVFIFRMMGAVSNAFDFDELTKHDAFFNLMHHIDLLVAENFLVVSGFLVMKSLMESKRKPIISLIQRYMRLIGSLSFMIFYTIAVSKYTGDGPLWNKIMGREQKYCEENWFLSLLMVNNYVKSDRICQLVTWYVQCDFQLAIIGTILFCIWQWNRRVGKVTTVVASVLALILPGIVTYWRRLPAIMMYEIDALIDVRSNEVYLDTYIKSYHRAGPYLIGMALAYIMVVYQPAKYRGIISRKWSYIGYTTSTILALKVWTAASAWCLVEYNAWDSALYAAFNRNIWAVCTCMCIFITEYGDVPGIRSFTAWPGFVIINRLAYGVYITHSVTMIRNFALQRNPTQHDMYAYIVTGLGVLAMSSIHAILLWLFIEAPLSNLTNLIFVTKKRTNTNRIMNEEKNNGHVVTELKNGKHL